LSYTYLFFHQQRLSDYFLKKTIDGIIKEIKKEKYPAPQREKA